MKIIMKKTIVLLTVLSGLFVNAQSSWSLTGNSGTNSNTNFLGTMDNQDLVLKTNNIERARISKNGAVGIGQIIDDNYFLTTRDAKFNLNESPNSFVVRNNLSDYNLIRTNTDDVYCICKKILVKLLLAQQH